MTDPTPTSPLWQIMRDASYTVDALGIGSDDRFMRKVAAAELRAIAKWIEQRAASSHTVSSEDMPTVWRIVGMLQVEADRAEVRQTETIPPPPHA